MMSERRGGTQTDTDPEAEKFRKMFIGGLNYDTTEESLKSHFQQWGDIVDCVVMRDSHTKRSRGFGFITYKCSYMVNDAQKNRPHKIDGREVDSKRAIPRNEGGEFSQASVKKVFVGGIKEEMTDEDIKNAFSQFGQIESIELIKDKQTGKKRGFGFVTFDDYDSVDKCVLKRRLSVGGKTIEVKKAVSRSDLNEKGGRGQGIGRMRGMRAGGGGSGGGGDWNSQGSNYSSNYGGFNQGYPQSGGYGNNQGWNQSSNWNNDMSGGSYDRFTSGYSSGAGGNCEMWGNSFGTGYGSSSTGPIRGTNYNQRAGGPYGVGYSATPGYRR